ncbi:nuclear nucleic acid-binding protein C1D isoform X2 [Athalia rosae]|uniref:nuclear nucleic acid-binding protein C1D isoform X2 n=1 Tax=Athalia rosae TaxID=37344 RepID=UPI00203434CA|nr:nuclear nucleic acid-binding protein C1D isoform X2 [Athalia rosae]
MDIKFEELASNADLVAKVKNFHQSTEKINELLSLASNPEFYDKLTNSDKLKYNLLMSYSLNTLFWMYLRLEGEDPMKHEIKSENDRLKQYMVRAKQIKERDTIMPRVKRDVAQRFVRSGLWEPTREKSDTGRSGGVD